MFRGMYRGSGQGGGGSVDYSRVIEKTTIIPAAESADLWKTYMYDGVSTGDYVHGYIYQLVATQNVSAVSFSGSIIQSWAVSDFVLYMKEGGSAYNEVTHGTLTYDASGNLWDLVGYDVNENEVLRFHEYTEDLEDFGCVFASETHQDGENCQFTLTTVINGKKWKRIDVQPGGSSGGVISVNGQSGVVTLGINDVAPTQTGYSGRVLGTDGFVAGWVEPTTITFRTWGANE